MAAVDAHRDALTGAVPPTRNSTSLAGYGTKPEFARSIESMTTCRWDRLGVVKIGETVGLHAYYDSDVAVPDAMGIMIAYLFETDDPAGGTEPPPGVTEPASSGGSGPSADHHH